MNNPPDIKQPASAAAPQARYGIDAPTAMRNLVVLGIGCIGAGIAAQFAAYAMRLGWLAVAGGMCAISGAWFLMSAGVMLWGSLIGKMRLRDKVLALAELRGDEMVLDVGCGHGLMLIGAARRLGSGHAVGIDIWSNIDQASNSAAATMANVRAEGVEDRVELRTADMRELPFPDDAFDVVLSSWAIHNLNAAEERERALREIVRVLKPGGRVAIVDIRHTARYLSVLQAAGLRDLRRFGRSFLFVIPTHIVTGTK
ncbi:MAG TPA: class I SAM-dependent methyltransferase [Candidatus Kapabacteria bacterium]|nr:class I SAM-dependent methyltransferase [Candidatus Kapabacteria bacterium]